MKLILGCVADDFTGASDAASFLVNHGVPTVLFDGIPAADSLADCAVVVIALKCRSKPAAAAVSEALCAFRWLREQNAGQLYFKYCSTFDSTPAGNIGPIADEVLGQLGIRYTLLCPSLPVNLRTVRNGNLYVDGVPLHESPMKNHPLNPMWASDIAELMGPQSRYGCLVLDQDMMNRPKESILRQIDVFGAGREHFYVVPDYFEESHGENISRVFGDLPFLTGGSGLLAHLADRARERHSLDDGRTLPEGTSGKGILLSGSCSPATREQIRIYRQNGGEAYGVDAARLRCGTQTADDVWSAVGGKDGALVYSLGLDGAPKDAEIHRQEAAALEALFAELGRRAARSGYGRIIVAGGETSGVVAQALHYSSYYIGGSIAPGVPVMIPTNAPEMRLVYKSGNFGQPDFFLRALKATAAGR